MGHHTDQHEVSPTSPRRAPAKPVANGKEYKKRLVPYQHNHGDPIVVPKPPPEVLAQLRRQFKKARRKASAAALKSPAEPKDAQTSDEPTPLHTP